MVMRVARRSYEQAGHGSKDMVNEERLVRWGLYTLASSQEVIHNQSLARPHSPMVVVLSLLA